jgi:hypothetical protein
VIINLAITLATFVASPAPQDELPPIIIQEESPDVVSGKIIEHLGKKYLCGLAKIPNVDGPRRYVFSLEQDWRIYEPELMSKTWKEVDATINEICTEPDE